MLLRETALRFALRQAVAGVHEVGGNNHGPQVKLYLAEVGLPEGYSWCDAFVSWCFHQAAGGKKLPFESAGVAITYNYARAHNWVVDRPLRGDLVVYDWQGNGTFDDHIGFVLRVIQLGPILILKTVEGNTSSGIAGSQSDGDGVFIRTRTIRKSSVRFIRVPGDAAVTIPDPTVKVPAPQPKPAPAPAPKPAPQVKVTIDGKPFKAVSIDIKTK